MGASRRKLSNIGLPGFLLRLNVRNEWDYYFLLEEHPSVDEQYPL